ncbi:MAG: hypothetical protein ISS43_00345 [Candidatus Omnitrophica bacterium]|nr:hypothetical protein [Candidatus Omnitrophota bacterium]
MVRKSIWLALLVCLIFVVEGCGRAKRVEIRHRYKRGRAENLTPQELTLENTLKEAAKLKAAKIYATGMFDVAYIIAAEHPDLGFTAYFKENKLVVERGLDTNKEPTLVIPLSDQAIFNAKYFFEDGVVDEREEFLIVNATFKPAWEASYRIPEIQSWWMRRFMNLDGLLHVILLNEKNYEFQGKVVKNELSVARVRDQWLVFYGLEGITDQRMELTTKDTIAMYKLIMWDLKQAKSLREKWQIMGKFGEIRTRSLVKR